MSHLLKLWLLLFILIVINGCGPTSEIKESAKDSLKENAKDTIITGGPLPLQWINYGGEKYVFNRIVSKEEVDLSQIVSTNALTVLGDGAESGNEIFLYKKDGSLFIIDNTGPTEQWANFSKNN